MAALDTGQQRTDRWWFERVWIPPAQATCIAACAGWNYAAVAILDRPFLRNPRRALATEVLPDAGQGDSGGSGGVTDRPRTPRRPRRDPSEQPSRWERFQQRVIRWRGGQLPPVIDGPTRIANNPAIIKAVGKTEAERIAKQVRVDDRFLDQDLFPVMKGSNR